MKEFDVAIFHTENSLEKSNCKGFLSFDGVKMGGNKT